MPSLMDVIRQNSAQMTSGQDMGPPDQTQQAANLLSAKSGKAITPGTATSGTYALSNLGEQQATQQAKQQIQNQVQPQATAQGQALTTAAEQQKQQLQTATAQVGQARRFNTLQTNLQTNQIMNDLERSKGAIDMQYNRMGVDQAATNLRLQNSAYVTQLQTEGAKARLTSQNNFQQSLAQSIFGDKLSILNATLKGQSVLDANKNTFDQAMANMSIDNANAILSSEIAAGRQASMYGGIGATVTGGVGAVGKVMDMQSSPATSSSTSSPDTGSADTGATGTSQSVAQNPNNPDTYFQP